MATATLVTRTVEIMFADQNQIALLERVYPLINVVVALSCQQIIDFVRLVDMVGGHAEWHRPQRLLDGKAGVAIIAIVSFNERLHKDNICIFYGKNHNKSEDFALSYTIK